MSQSVIWWNISREQDNLFSWAKGSEIKPESEISSHITLMSVISGLFHTRYLHWNSYVGNSGVKLAKTH